MQYISATHALALLNQAHEQQYPLLHFAQSTPQASIGRFEARCHAIREDFCQQQGIVVQRRLTGGGAVYLDGGQGVLTLVVPLASSAMPCLAQWLQRLNTAVAAGLGDLGLDAQAQAPNSIDVAQRQVAQGTLAWLPGGLLYQLFLLGTMDVTTTLQVLRAPREKLTDEGIRSAREHFTTLQEVLGRPVDWRAVEQALWQALSRALGATPQRITAQPITTASVATTASLPPVNPWLDRDWQVDENQSWQAFLPTTGGVLYLRVQLDATRQRIQEAVFSTTAQLAPLDWLTALEERLAGVSLEQGPEVLKGCLATQPYTAVGFNDQDMFTLLGRVLGRAEQQQLGLSVREANTLMVVAPRETVSTTALLKRCGVVLVPYCAKAKNCPWRHEDHCTQCGACAVGEVYALAEVRGLEVITITHYEHLCQTLTRLKQEGIEAYLGMCCGHFYLKRAHAFADSGLPAILADIRGANCYALNQEELAYQGAFRAQAQLNQQVIVRLLAQIPSRSPRTE